MSKNLGFFAQQAQICRTIKLIILYVQDNSTSRCRLDILVFQVLLNQPGGAVGLVVEVKLKPILQQYYCSSIADRSPICACIYAYYVVGACRYAEPCQRRLVHPRQNSLNLTITLSLTRPSIAWENSRNEDVSRSILWALKSTFFNCQS